MRTISKRSILDTATGELVNRTLMREGSAVREFYSRIPRPVCGDRSYRTCWNSCGLPSHRDL